MKTVTVQVFKQRVFFELLGRVHSTMGRLMGFTWRRLPDARYRLELDWRQDDTASRW